PSETPIKETESNYVTVHIKKGMWSESVSNAMKDAGLVKNAESFNEFLTDNGYASFISVGSYQIKEGSTYEEIARKITGK
ncbi:MAG: hypothetical protein RSJ40_09730, partial [Acetivibrio sp.]